MVDYTLIRARRRTAAIQIQKDGQVVVRAPMRLPKKEIERFLQEKESWILAQQQRMRQRQQRREQFALSDGRLPLLGKFFPLEQTDSAKPSYQDGVAAAAAGAAALPADCPGGADAAGRFLRAKARRTADGAAHQRGEGKVGLLLRKEQSEFQLAADAGAGALRQLCGGARAVPHFTSRPQRRLLHHDHSAAFWREVERFFPDWKECRRQLAEVAGAAYFFEE